MLPSAKRSSLLANVSATRAFCESTGWQAVKINRNKSSVTSIAAQLLELRQCAVEYATRAGRIAAAEYFFADHCGWGRRATVTVWYGSRERGPSRP
jgi:hypothetical protein